MLSHLPHLSINWSKLLQTGGQSQTNMSQKSLDGPTGQLKVRGAKEK